MTEDEYAGKVKRQTDTYLRSIQTLICIDSALRWDDSTGSYRPDAQFLPGRRMHTSSDNQVSPDTTVTPDIVEQIDRTYGIVGDVKLTASSDRDFRKAERQLRKYDDHLVNWRTPGGTVNGHDLLLIADYSHARQLEQFLGQQEAYARPFVFVSLVRGEMADVFYSLEKRLGQFSDSGIDAKFANVVSVPLEKLTRSFPNVKFYDARPQCDEHTMDVLWREYFPRCAETRQRVRSGRTVTQRRVEVGEAREFLERGYAIVPGGIEHQPEVPQRSWVRDALDKFVKIQRAQRGDRPGEYWVEYSGSARTAHLQGFARALFRKQQRPATKPGQSTKGQHPALPLDE